jgi:hypothetical protein
MQHTADFLTSSAQTRSALSILSPSTWLRGLGSMLWGERSPILVPPAIAKPARELPYVRYRARRRSLPNSFTTTDWDRAVEYWALACAVCERPRGLWHTLSQDHWVPLTHPNCPGTIATNMLPLCYGADGCNNSKGKKDPNDWLIEKLGKRKGKKKLRQIQTYFDWIAELKAEVIEVVECPACSYTLLYDEITGLWHCDTCRSDWRERQQ